MPDARRERLDSAPRPPRMKSVMDHPMYPQQQQKHGGGRRAGCCVLPDIMGGGYIVLFFQGSFPVPSPLK